MCLQKGINKSNKMLSYMIHAAIKVALIAEKNYIFLHVATFISHINHQKAFYFLNNCFLFNIRNYDYSITVPF